jgi:RNA polymerase-binding transcription factor DksA
MSQLTLDTLATKKLINDQLQELAVELQMLERRLENKPDFGLGAGSPGVYSWEMALNRKERATQQQEELHLALERIKAGVYGVCQQCGQPINPERLEILPATPLCVTCSAAVEESGVQPDVVLAI